jgi:hypothetical protein
LLAQNAIFSADDSTDESAGVRTWGQRLLAGGLIGVAVPVVLLAPAGDHLAEAGREKNRRERSSN